VPVRCRAREEKEKERDGVLGGAGIGGRGGSSHHRRLRPLRELARRRPPKAGTYAFRTP